MREIHPLSELGRTYSGDHRRVAQPRLVGPDVLRHEVLRDRLGQERAALLVLRAHDRLLKGDATIMCHREEPREA
eukprot:3537761-Pyramimonas_sp.AAC.1